MVLKVMVLDALQQMVCRRVQLPHTSGFSQGALGSFNVSCVKCFQVYLLGDVGIEEEFDLKGISYLGGPGDADQKVELKAGYAMPHDPDVTPSAIVFSCPMHACLFPSSQDVH